MRGTKIAAATPVTTATPMAVPSLSDGASMARKTSGTANSSPHDVGMNGPSSAPATLEICHTIHSDAPPPK